MSPKIVLEKVNELSLLCNYENGAIVFIDDANIEIVRNCTQTGDYSLLPAEMQQYLEECAFFSETEDQMKQAYVHITDRCNMNCKGCYSRTSFRNKTADLSLEEINTIFEQLQRNSISKIVFSGGEPFLRTDIYEILSCSKAYGFENVVISNGSIAISNAIYSKIDTIAFSVDYLEDEYNTLGRKIHKEMLLDNIQKARSQGVDVGGIITINSLNIDHVEDYFRLSMEYQLPISFSIFYSSEDGCETLLLRDDQLRQFIEKCQDSMSMLVEGFNDFDDIFCRNHCSIGCGNISVDARGNLTPCHILSEYKLGNLIDDPERAWANLDRFVEALDFPDACKSCDYKVFCGGGCKARAYIAAGFEGKDPYCEMYQAYYEQQYKYIKTLIDT